MSFIHGSFEEHKKKQENENNKACRDQRQQKRLIEIENRIDVRHLNIDKQGCQY